jgi:hypothetical protein
VKRANLDVQLHIGESRESPTRNGASEVWSFGPSRNDEVSLQMRHRHDPIGVQLAGLVDRDIFAGHETFVGEVKRHLVRHFGIVERPAAAAMNEMTVVVLPAGPKSRDPACLTMFSP